eukprot:TRINITY_DN3786_c0_g1_i2.p1 TRINITY_DN3786_c0_g1~~TRINITY_DN3786_c0_g1_i2.p1  ORF type:complete len:343 (+),score=80.69 TRINITY_DN3786_c0_g1_i2:111-1139(+)
MAKLTIDLVQGITELSNRAQVKALFEQFGEVTACWLPPRGLREGPKCERGYVKFSRSHAAEAAFEACKDGKVILWDIPVKAVWRDTGATRQDSREFDARGSNFMSSRDMFLDDIKTGRRKGGGGGRKRLRDPSSSSSYSNSRGRDGCGSRSGRARGSKRSRSQRNRDRDRDGRTRRPSGSRKRDRDRRDQDRDGRSTAPLAIEDSSIAAIEDRPRTSRSPNGWRRMDKQQEEAKNTQEIDEEIARLRREIGLKIGALGDEVAKAADAGAEDREEAGGEDPQEAERRRLQRERRMQNRKSVEELLEDEMQRKEAEEERRKKRVEKRLQMSLSGSDTTCIEDID